MLSDKEQQAIETLESYGWQVINGAHLEDWDEGQSVLIDSRKENMKVRSSIAIIKL